MLGGIVGDYVGSVWEYKEWNGTDELINGKNFITDDSLVLLATMQTLIKYYDDYKFHNVSLFGDVASFYKQCLLEVFKENPHAGWGNWFSDWVQGNSEDKPKSIGNGFMPRLILLDKFTPSGLKLLAWQYDSDVVISFKLKLYGFDLEALDCDYFEGMRECIEDMYWFHKHRRFDDTYFGCINRLMCVFYNMILNYEQDIISAIYVNGDSDTFACTIGTYLELYMKNGTKEVVDYMNKYDITLDKLFAGNQKYIKIVKEFYKLYFPEAYIELDMENL